MKNIWAVCKDPGGTAGILPVVDVLSQRGYNVQLFADGKAVDLLPATRRVFATYDSAQIMLEQMAQRPRLLITSMCSDGGVGRDLVPFLRSDTTIIALQDTYGARLKTDWSALQYRPDFICVNDTIGRDIVHRAWPDFDVEHILMTGYPALDRYASYDAQEASDMVRAQLGLTQAKPIVLYCGQVGRAGQVLHELVMTLNAMGRDIYLIVREHARMRDDAPDEVAYWQQALSEFTAGTLISETSTLSTQALLASASVIVSMYSTVLIEAIALHKPNIALLYPDMGMRQFLSETGYTMQELPLVTLGCTAKATNRSELARLLFQSFDGTLDLRAAQKQNFRLDGLNAQRVADSILM